MTTDEHFRLREPATCPLNRCFPAREPSPKPSTLQAASAGGAPASVLLRCLRISPDGKHLAAGDRHGSIRVYCLASMRLLVTKEAHDAEVLSLDYSNQVCVRVYGRVAGRVQRPGCVRPALPGHYAAASHQKRHMDT